jgi:hypothetical protein
MWVDIDSRHWKISTGRHFQNGHHNTAHILHCPISTPFHMWVDYNVPNWFLTLQNFYRSPFSKWPPQYRDYSVQYYSAVRPVICKGWHFTHMWKILTWLHHLTYKGKSGHMKPFYPAIFYLSAWANTGKRAVVYLYVRGIDFILFLRLLYWIVELFR